MDAVKKKRKETENDFEKLVLSTIMWRGESLPAGKRKIDQKLSR